MTIHGPAGRTGCDCRNEGSIGDTKSAGLTVKMLQSQVPSTFSAVFPRNNPFTPLRPTVPMAIKSIFKR